ncbi:MAG: hypothetical protein R2698_06705 [Microthrixaceae bacterium]
MHVRRRSHRFSLGSVVLACGLGAFTTLGVVAALWTMGDDPTTAVAEGWSGDVGIPVRVAPASESAGTPTVGGGIRLGSGVVVTAIRAPSTRLQVWVRSGSKPAGSTLNVASRASNESGRWVDATYVGSYSKLGLTVVRVPQLANTSADRVRQLDDDGGQLVDYSPTSTLGDTVTLDLPVGSPRSACPGGTAQLSQPRGATGSVVVDRDRSAIVALVVPTGTVGGTTAVVVPATTARRVGQRIASGRDLIPGRLPFGVTESPDGLMADVNSGTSRLLAVDHRTVDDSASLAALLEGRFPGDQVFVTLADGASTHTIAQVLAADPASVPPTTDRLGPSPDAALTRCTR